MERIKVAIEHVRRQLAGSRCFWIGTTRPDGGPHAAPVWGYP